MPALKKYYCRLPTPAWDALVSLCKQTGRSHPLEATFAVWSFDLDSLKFELPMALANASWRDGHNIGLRMPMSLWKRVKDSEESGAKIVATAIIEHAKKPAMPLPAEFMAAMTEESKKRKRRTP